MYRTFPYRKRCVQTVSQPQTFPSPPDGASPVEVLDRNGRRVTYKIRILKIIYDVASLSFDGVVTRQQILSADDFLAGRILSNKSQYFNLLIKKGYICEHRLEESRVDDAYCISPTGVQLVEATFWYLGLKVLIISHVPCLKLYRFSTANILDVTAFTQYMQTQFPSCLNSMYFADPAECYINMTFSSLLSADAQTAVTQAAQAYVNAPLQVTPPAFYLKCSGLTPKTITATTWVTLMCSVYQGSLIPSLGILTEVMSGSFLTPSVPGRFHESRLLV